MIERKVRDKASGEQTLESVYGITSQTPDQADAVTWLQQYCNHRTIENRSHWVRDVTFGEDRSSIHSDTAPHTLAAIRNFVIGLLRLLGFDNLATARKGFAASARNTLALLKL